MWDQIYVLNWSGFNWTPCLRAWAKTLNIIIIKMLMISDNALRLQLVMYKSAPIN